ncbi:MAG: PqqD family protein [Caldiserica bacterium]|nr:PqqD family protein [Caldisericota bacterium]
MRYYRQNQEAVYRQEGEEAFLFHPGEDRLYLLNEVACYIWEWCKEPLSEEVIINKLAEIFPEVEKANLKKDVKSFIDSLLKRNLLIVNNNA